MKKICGWGVSFTPDVKKAGDHRCPYCGFGYPYGLKLYTLIVGFACDCEWQLREHREFGKALGIMVFECPECLEKGWMHLYPPAIDLAMEYCSKWPK